MIYELAFHAFDEIQALGNDKPNTHALRVTCRTISNDTARTWSMAMSTFRQTRKKLLQDFQRTIRAKSDYANSHVANRYTALGFGLMAVDADERFCKHDCGCYDKKQYCCADVDHEDCFQCGRWNALAILFDLNPTFAKSHMLPLVADDNSGMSTVLGRLIGNYAERLPQPGADRYPELTSRYPTGFEAVGATWWLFELRLQKEIDKRCRVRRCAVEKFYQSSGQRIREVYVENIERRHWRRELEKFEKFEQEVVLAPEELEGRNTLDWKTEYKRRICLEAQEEGLDEEIAVDLWVV